MMDKPAVHKRDSSGFSLVEIVVGMAILAFIISSTAVWMVSLSRQSVATTMSSKMSQKLRSVAEQIRSDAPIHFDTMEGNQDRTGSLYPDIMVTSSIGPINATSRTRRVVLTARSQPEGQPVLEQTMTFDIGHVEAAASGAQAKFRAVKYGTDIGIPGVVVAGPGQEVDVVSCVTDLTGTCTLYGVQVSATGIDVTFDGIRPRHYFAPPETFGYSFVGTFHFPETLASEMNDFTNKPAQMRAPGRITGRVVDTRKNAVPNAEVFLFKKPGTLVIDVSLAGVHESTTTNSEGEYSFAAVVPGTYFLHMAGNEQYAAVALPNDNHQGTNPNRDEFAVSVGSDELFRRDDFITVKKGSMKGRVFGVTRGGVGFNHYTKGAASPSGVNFTLRTTPSVSYSGNTKHDFSNTTVWKEILSKRVSDRRAVTTGSNGWFQTDHFSPHIVNYDETFDKENQSNKVLVCPSSLMVDPFVPVVVELPPPQSNVQASRIKFMGIDSTESLYFKPHSAPAATQVHFEERLYTCDLDNDANSNIEIYFLERNSLLRHQGALLSGGQMYHFGPSTIHQVAADTRYSGGVEYLPGGTVRYVPLLNTDTYMMVDKAGVSHHVYAFQQDVGGVTKPTLLPAVGNDPMPLYYGEHGAPSTFTHPTVQVIGTVKAWEKKLVGGVVNYQPVSLIGTNMNVPLKLLDVFGTVHWQVSAVSVMNGSFSVSKKVDSVPYYADGSVTVLANEFQWGADTNIQVAEHFHRRNGNFGFIVAGENSGWAYDWGSPLYLSSDQHIFPSHLGPFFGETADLEYRSVYNPPESVPLVRKGRTGMIYGRVVDYAGRVIENSTVTFTRSGGFNANPYDPTYDITEKNACPSCGANDFQFSFDPAEFVMVPGYNLWLKVEADGYQVVEEGCEAYDGFTREWNFTLYPDDTDTAVYPGL